LDTYEAEAVGYGENQGANEGSSMGRFFRRFAALNAPFLAKNLRALAEQIEHLFPGTPVMATPPIFHYEGRTEMGMISVEANAAPLHATVVFLDAEGNETTPDDVPQWSSDNDASVSVEASEDGLSGTCTPTGVAGAAVISVDTTNTDGSTVHSQGTITVLPGDAVSGDVQFEEAAPTA
jgi:hypothetical protein